MTDQRHQNLGPPPVEPLSDAAWSRVERGVWLQLDAGAPAGSPPPPPRRWWLVATPLLAAAAVAAVVVATRGRPIDSVDEPSRVLSGTAPSSVSFGDSHIELDATTALVMGHEAQHPRVLLERGAAWFTVAPRLQRPAFIVRAGDATVRVVGTRFRVARSEERIAVDVERGLVNVEFRGSVVPVAAGQHWSSDVPGRIASLAPVASVTTAPSGDAMPSADVPELPDTAAPGAAPPAPDAKSPRHRPHHPAASNAGVRTEATPAEPTPGVTLADESDVDRDRAEYDRLAALEPRSPEAALAGYMALARGTSRWADPALFAAARLATDRHDRRAETLLGIYLQRFPSGANATDARQLLARLKGEKGDRP